MTDGAALISGIEYKVHQLIGRLKALQMENEHLKKEHHELIKTKGEQTETIEELTQKINIIKTIKIIETKEGTVEAKVKINELLREIDKCIGLLNS
ncbi:MAG: hypothetical protein V1733_05895 [bacterium]